MADVTIILPLIESITGKDYITGEDLTDLECGLKAAGAIIDLLTFGDGAILLKAANKGTKEFVFAVGKTMAVDALASGASYLTGQMLEDMGMPAGLSTIMTAIVSGTVTYSAGRYFFKNEAGEILKECTEDELEKLLKGEMDDALPEMTTVKGKATNDIKRIEAIEVEFNFNSKYNEEEFARQLADQEKGMNELTVREYLDNRQKYLDEGRALESNAAQQAAREKAFVDKVDELQDSGLSLKEAEEQAQQWLNTQAALHNPDQVAGGKANKVDGLGDKDINSSIGAQWRYRIDDVDEQIKKMAEGMTESEKQSTYLNVSLFY